MQVAPATCMQQALLTDGLTCACMMPCACMLSGAHACRDQPERFDMPDDMGMDMMPDYDMQLQQPDVDAQQQLQEGNADMLLAPEDGLMDQHYMDEVFAPPAPPTPPPTPLEVSPGGQGQVWFGADCANTMRAC